MSKSAKFFRSRRSPEKVDPSHLNESVERHDEISVIETQSRKDKYFVFYMLLLITIACCAIVWPKCNYDGVFYTALTVRTADAKVLQQAGMQFEGNQLEDLRSPYNDDLMRNPDHFKEQLPFYSVKPLYVAILTLARMSGMGWRAGAFISSASYLLLGGIVWRWLRHYYTGVAVLVLACVMMLDPTLLQVIRWTSPDLMAVSIAVTGTYLILEKEMFVIGALTLMAGIYVRPETIIYANLAIFAIFLSKRLKLLKVLVLLALSLGSYFIITRSGYPYSTMFYHTFIDMLAPPAEVNVIVTKSEYLTVLKHSVQGLCSNDPLLCLPIIICVMNYVVLHRQGIFAMFSAVAVASSLLLYIAHPDFEGRYYISGLVFIPVLVLLTEIGKVLFEARNKSARAGICVSPLELNSEHP